MDDSPFVSMNGSEPSLATPRDDERLRLRLHHILVLTAVVAVLLAINGPVLNYGSNNYNPADFFRILSLSLYTSHTLLSAVALTALGYGIAWHRRGTRLFNQPGHWLLLDISIRAFLDFVPRVVIRSGAAINMAYIGPVFLAVIVIKILLEVYLGMRKCRERRWKSVFYVMATANLFFGVGSLFVLFVII